MNGAAGEHQLIGSHFHARKSRLGGGRHWQRIAFDACFRCLSNGRIGHGTYEGLPVDEAQFLGLDGDGDTLVGKSGSMSHGNIAQGDESGAIRRQLQQYVEAIGRAHFDHVTRLAVKGDGGKAKGRIPSFRRAFLERCRQVNFYSLKRRACRNSHAVPLFHDNRRDKGKHAGHMLGNRIEIRISCKPGQMRNVRRTRSADHDRAIGRGVYRHGGVARTEGACVYVARCRAFFGEMNSAFDIF